MDTWKPSTPQIADKNVYTIEFDVWDRLVNATNRTLPIIDLIQSKYQSKAGDWRTVDIEVQTYNIATDLSIDPVRYAQADEVWVNILTPRLFDMRDQTLYVDSKSGATTVIGLNCFPSTTVAFNSSTNVWQAFTMTNPRIKSEQTWYLSPALEEIAAVGISRTTIDRSQITSTKPQLLTMPIRIK